jgi:hypothetical protein
MDEPNFDEFFDDLSDEETEEIIQFLVENGAAEWNGFDEFGEKMFKFNLEVLKEIMPMLHQQIIEDLDNTLLDLFEKGLVEVEYDENLEATFYVSEDGKKALKDLGMDYLDEE